MCIQYSANGKLSFVSGTEVEVSSNKNKREFPLKKHAEKSIFCVFAPSFAIGLWVLPTQQSKIFF